MIVAHLAAKPRPCQVIALGVLGAQVQLPGPAAAILGAELARTSDYLATFAVSGEAGEVLRLPLPEGSGPAHVLLFGLGDGSVAALRIAAVALGRAIAAGDDAHVVTVAMDAPGREQSRAVAEGLVLGGYDFDLSSAPRDALHMVQLAGDFDAAGLSAGDAAADAAGWARDLGNTPADRLTPANFGARAAEQLTAAGCTVLVRDVDWLTEQGFGALLAVGGGAAAKPTLIHASWVPAGRRSPSQPHIVLVGKGITFDSGGLNLKPADGMRMMYTDMCGGAAVLAAINYAAVQKLPIRVSALVPAAENSVSETAMRPSDVITHFGGRTTEVGNTDAEGRLVLADALAYAVATLRPDVLIDVATLTGAMKVALGTETAGYLANDDQLASALESAGLAAAEPIWRLPLERAHLPLLDSPIADSRNDPGAPGAITAALFLEPFVAGVPWAHLDIAGTARAAADGPIFSKGATGFGARLLARYLEAAAG